MSSSSSVLETSSYSPQSEVGTAGRVDALTVSQFYRYIDDTRWQPSWRVHADKCVDYYDGNQLDADTLHALQLKGMGPIIKNVIAPIVNVVLGMEAKTRSDWRVTSDDDAHSQVAEAMSAKLKEIERESRADRACSDAYAGQIKSGMGWIEVGRPMDPFQYPHRCEYVHRREIYWDWRAKKPDLSDARYIMRKRWYDVDEAIAFFPEWRELLSSMVGDQMRYRMIRQMRGTELGMDLDVERGLDMEDYELWRSFDRRRVCLYEVWSRHFVRGHVIRLPDRRVFEFDKKNQMHIALAQRGIVQPTPAVYSKMQMSIWAGPNRLYSTTVKKNCAPYIPFWGYREDRTGVPYGLIRAMLSPQDEVNARRQKLMWLLGAKRVLMDSDALDLETMDTATMLQEIARPDAVVILNPNRINKAGAFQVDDNLAAAREQYQMAQDAEGSVQAVVGVFNSLLGKESSASSGRAIDSLVEQGTTALAEINDNYRFARRLVGERLMEQAREDLMGQQVTVQVETVMGRKRVIQLNQVVVTDAGEQLRVNDVETATVKVALDDTPSSASYRQQQFVMLSEVMKGMPPELQAAIAPFWMMASDLQHRKDMADAMRKAIGQQVEPQNEEEAAQMQQAAQEQAQVKQVQFQSMLLELKEREAKVNEINARAQKAMAEAGGNPALDGARSEYEAKIAEAEDRARQEIDRLTMEVMNTRNASVLRETKLMGEVTKLVAQIERLEGSQESQALKAQAEQERSGYEVRIAEINAEKDKEVARLQAAQADVIKKLEDQLSKLKDEMVKRIDATVAAAEKRDEVRDAKMEKAEKEPKEAPPISVEVRLESGAIQVNGSEARPSSAKRSSGDGKK